jgi:hypothetical protein
MNSKINRILVGCIIISLCTSYFLTTHKNSVTSLLVHYKIINADQEFSYVTPAYEQLINESDIVFVGTLTDISPSKWNQDSGEYWTDESPTTTAVIQYHTLTFDVSQFIINKTKPQDVKSIEITVLGPSPLDKNADYSLSVGDNVVIFARETELAWKEGNHRKPIIEIATAPELALFVQFDKPDGPYRGKIIHDLGKGDFTTEDISLSLQDFISQIQSVAKSQLSP